MSTNPLRYGPYNNDPALDAGDTADTGLVVAGIPVLETILTAFEQLVDIGNGLGLTTHAEVFNGAIPGPTFRLTVGQTVVVRLVNNLPHPTGIHWHGIELANYSDGTEVTQDQAIAGPAAQLLGLGGPMPTPVPAGGTFLYKFKVTRPGIFWYHPHHHNSMNRVFRGMYGMIVVTDPLETNIVRDVANPSRPLPAAADTMQLVLSDITVCKAPGSNLNATLQDTTYDNPTTLPLAERPEWLSGATAQTGTSPRDFCEIPIPPALQPPPGGSAKNDDGNPAAVSYGAGDVPSVARPSIVGTRTVIEGQTVLTNGVNVGGRPGTPAAPGTLPVASFTKPVLSGQGIRLQIVNCAHLRYFRLRLTTAAGVQVPLVRIGGEGGLLDNAILEGGTVGTLDTQYDSGEILLPPATRADVVAAIPTGLSGTKLTLWTRDYRRIGGGGFSQLPTVPVMHLDVTGDAPAGPGVPYIIVGRDDNAIPPVVGTALRGPATGLPVVQQMPLVENIRIPAPTGTPFDPAPNPPRIPVSTATLNSDIKIQTGGGIARIDNVPASAAAAALMLMGSPTYAFAAHLGSSRYAEEGKLLELTVTNTSEARHPFHLHGFSFQPIEFRLGAALTAAFTWTYQEFRDTIDLPPGYTLKFRVRTEDPVAIAPRPLVDGVTPGGALGRWLFHCHIFFHHRHGMISELVVTNANANRKEKPNVNVGGSWAYASTGLTTTRRGTFYHPEGGVLVTTLSLTPTMIKTVGGVSVPPGTVTVLTSPVAGVSPGTWEWTSPVTADGFYYVYITVTDTDGRKDQAVFRLQVGAPDAGSDNGDPHIHTVDGKNYDFQAAGEFTLLRDREGMEIQVRQTPVETPPPYTSPYSGLTECVSLNTAIAARVGSHRIAYLPVERGRYRFFLDGEPALLTTQGIDLEGHRVSGFDVGGETGLRVDYEHNAVLTVTPRLWTSYGLRYLDVSVSNTNGDEGLMGRIPKGTWLPLLPSGASVGPMPPVTNLHDRHVALNQIFANAWRVTDQTSLFVYLQGTSTATFTDLNWPAEKPPCTLKPGFQEPANPIRENIPIEKAKQICKGVTEKDLHDNCVFDVVTTGDAEFAKGYLIAQELRLCGTAVQIVGDKPQTRSGESLVVTATVLPLTPGRPVPKGGVTFVIDGVPVKKSVKLDEHGRAQFTVADLKAGEHAIRAAYSGGDDCHSSSSPNLLHTVMKGRMSCWKTFILCVCSMLRRRCDGEEVQETGQTRPGTPHSGHGG